MPWSPKTRAPHKWSRCTIFDIDEIAQLLEVTRRTIDRDLRFARAFLQTRLPA